MYPPRAFVAALAIGVSATAAHATTVAVQNFGGAGVANGRIVVTFENSGSSWIQLEWFPPNLTGGGLNLGMSNHWFILPSSGAFGPDYILNTTPFATNGPGPIENPVSVDFSMPIVLGSFTDYTGGIGSDGAVGPGDIFVWMEVEPDFNQSPVTFQINDFGIDETGRGIFIGTQQSVPEPSVPTLVLSTVVPCLARRRR